MNKSSRAVKRISESAGSCFCCCCFLSLYGNTFSETNLKAQLSILELRMVCNYRSPSLSFKDSGVRLWHLYFYQINEVVLLLKVKDNLVRNTALGINDETSCPMMQD